MKTETLELLNEQNKKAALARDTLFDYAKDVMYRENKTLGELQELGFIVYDDMIGLPKGTEFIVASVGGVITSRTILIFRRHSIFNFLNTELSSIVGSAGAKSESFDSSTY